jgi:homospermidine synthase
MAAHKKHVAFPGKMVVLGFGSIGQAVLPLLLRHIDMQPSQVTIIAKDEQGIEIAQKYGIKHVKETLTRKNYEAALDPYLGEGGFLVNVSVEVESLALMKYCRAKKVLYIGSSRR